MSQSVVKIRRATWLDLVLLTPRLRAADVAECEALFGKNTTPVIAAETYRNSPLRYTVEVDKVVTAMFGVAAPTLLSDVGYPWMFGTDDMYRAPRRAFIEQSQKYITAMLQFFPKLENVVDSRNVKGVRWLKRMGFVILPAVPMGPDGVPFHPFSMEV